ncbi:hypothetical protein [Teichococcus aestuarii]|uniref:hypothetical protein n=1 Tax=Teichococcus aestuarii TaxID=568898 RepID=UPI0036108C6F
MSAKAFQRTTEVFISRHASPQEQSRILAETARKGVAELVASRRASPQYDRFVDGIRGAPEVTVRPGGVIAYQFQYMGEIAAFAWAFLRQRAPRKTGTYQDSFWFSVDGRLISPRSFDPAKVEGAKELIIFNRQPYARKVDVQLVGARRLRFSVPAGIMDDAAAAVRRRFGNMVTARRLYTVRFPGAEHAWTGPRAGRLLEYPAVAISVR